jgi:hypothetical protein
MQAVNAIETGRFYNTYPGEFTPPLCGSPGYLYDFRQDKGSSELLMKNRRSLTGREECSSMGSGFKDWPSVAKNRQKPSKIRFMTTLSRIIKSALEPDKVCIYTLGAHSLLLSVFQKC